MEFATRRALQLEHEASFKQEFGQTSDGTVDYEGKPANKSNTGGRMATPFICCIEIIEKMATSGAQFNLVTYLISKGIPLLIASKVTTNFIGTSYIMALFGGFLADTFFGRFKIIGFLMMMVTVVIPALDNQVTDCTDNPSKCRSVHGIGMVSIYMGLYLVVIGTGGTKACVSAFGADQFEVGDPKESCWMAIFFNWLYWCTTLGSLLSATLLIYLQDHIGWDWGYGILIILMLFALLFLILSRRRYRYRTLAKNSPLVTIARVFVASFINLNHESLSSAEVSRYYHHKQSQGLMRFPLHTKGLRFLDKAAKLPPQQHNNHVDDSCNDWSWSYAPINEVEDVKMFLRLIPIWFFTIYYWIIISQCTTFSVAQVATTNRSWGPNFKVPQGSVPSVTFNLMVVLILPIYDRLFVPFMQRITRNPKGLTSSQRIGIGLMTTILSSIIAAMTERKRLSQVHKYGVENEPKHILPFSMWNMVPQFVILGVGETFVYPGQLDFFYNEAPDSMQSLGTALLACSISVGFFSNSLIISIVNRATRTGQYVGWLQNNIDQSRLDLYYWLLAVLATINFILYLFVSYFHTYKQMALPPIVKELEVVTTDSIFAENLAISTSHTTITKVHT